MRILVTGQCTLHWGRMEFGNIGNYYVIKPFFEELRKAFPNAEIVTTFQMSEEFCSEEKISCLPMDLYYGWNGMDLDNAKREMLLAKEYAEHGTLSQTTPYISEVLASDLVIDYSGDIWGKNADLVGKNRFEVGLLKDRVAQLLKKKSAMLAGSPGPFNNDETLQLAKEVFRSFDLVTIREPISRIILEEAGFDLTKCIDCACPAFEFEGEKENIDKLLVGTPLASKRNHLNVGVILCGWNMEKGPFNREDWKDEEFSNIITALVYVVKHYDAKLCFLSHSNGFILPPAFKPIHGRDFQFAKRLYDILKKTDISQSIYLFEKLYSAKETKALIGNFDVLFSGRVHGAVAGISQNVPTVMIDYGHEPKAHKVRGFAAVSNLSDYVASPNSSADLIQKFSKCIENRAEIRSMLSERNKKIRDLIKLNFDSLKTLAS